MRVSFTVRVSVRVIQVAILSCNCEATQPRRNYYPLFELSDKMSDAQAVIFTCRLNNNSSNVFLLVKTVNTVK